jgi:exodeoxyribonuclease-3
MKILSYNLNGIRAAERKGFTEWLTTENPDIVCIQELKGQEPQIKKELETVKSLGYHVYIYTAQKKGYSGVAIFTKEKPLNVVYGIENELYDSEGRNLRCDYKNFSVMSIYVPSGTTGDIRQDFKMEFLDYFNSYIKKLDVKDKLIICGDFNICHKPIDIDKPQNKKGVSGFLPEEREWLTQFIDSGFIDSFREFNQLPEQYSWWSYRAASRSRNIGWRIDYNFINNNIKDKLKDANILSDVIHSDHCPICIEIDA